jgi:hypothetical protein
MSAATRERHRHGGQRWSGCSTGKDPEILPWAILATLESQLVSRPREGTAKNFTKVHLARGLTTTYGNGQT